MISKNISNRKAQSQIISTVILILLVLATATIIFSFVLPFVRDKLSSGNCLDVIGKLEIDHNPKYTCYGIDSSEDVTNLSLKVQIGDIRDLIEGFNIKLGGAEGKTIKIKNGTAITGVSMYSDSEIELPEDNGEKIYIIQISEKPDDIKIYSVLQGGKTCPVEDSILGDYIEDC